MTSRLSPLGLPFQYASSESIQLVGASAPAEAGISVSFAGDATVNIIGAEALAQSGIVVFVPPLRLSPLILPQLYPVPLSSSSVTAVTARALAQAGVVGVSVPVTGLFSQLGPLILPGAIRTSNAVMGGVDARPVGAQANAQGEGLEGADVTIYIDGAEALSYAAIGGVGIVDPGAAVSLVFVSRQTRDMALSIDTRNLIVTGSYKMISVAGSTRLLLLTGSEQQTFVESDLSGGIRVI